MLKIRLKSKVRGDKRKVFKEFNEKLFMYLLPPGAKLKQFGGSRKGDIVHIRFGFPFFTEWISEITEDDPDANSSYFIDEGRKLPFGLKKWKHRHIVHPAGDHHSVIEDDMRFSSGWRLFDLLLYPILLLAFLPRVIQYKNYFGWPRRKQ